MKILVFLHGTIIMHKNAVGRSREEIVKQVKEGGGSIRDYISHVPIGNAPQKLQKWVQQGAEIIYLSALTASKRGRGDEQVLGEEGLKADEIVLKKYGFPEGKIYHRKPGEEYKDVVECIDPLPDVLVEDDCESIGQEEMTYPTLPPAVRAKIKSIIVKEFGGIDHLPDDIFQLRSIN